MILEWITAKELLGVAGLPSSIQGLHKKAKIEGWEKKAVSVEGVRGRSFAYLVSTLPEHVQESLKTSDQYKHREENMKNDELSSILSSLSEEEKDKLLKILKRKGVEHLLKLCSEENQNLLDLSEERREIALSLATLPRKRMIEIFSQIQSAQGKQKVEEFEHKASA